MLRLFLVLFIGKFRLNCIQFLSEENCNNWQLNMNNPQYKNDVSVPFQVPANIADEDLRTWLIEKINLIDATKRSVTEQMSRFHDETIPKDRNRNFYAWIKRAKSYRSHLTEERARLVKLLGGTNTRLKENRRLKNKTKPNLQLAQTFMMVAEEVLDLETYKTIENKALNVLEA